MRRRLRGENYRPGSAGIDSKTGLPVDTAAFANGRSEFVEYRFRGCPVETSIGNALPVDKRCVVVVVLLACLEVAFDHDAHDCPRSARDLATDITRNGRLPGVVFKAVSMAAVDHDVVIYAGCRKLLLRCAN